MWFHYLFLCNLMIFNSIFAADIGDSCVPNNEISEGICTLIMKCSEAVRLVEQKRFHNFERCGFSGFQEVVCCPTGSIDQGNKFGIDRARTERIADRECKKIKLTSRAPLAPHIVGGELASVGEFPHMVAIGFAREERDVFVFDCGGTLVSSTYVLTAAHCILTIDGIEPSVIRAGVTSIGDKRFNQETDVRIAQITVHPSYIRREKYHDLALLRLQKPVEFSTYQNAACLYTSSEDPKIALTVTGWGQTDTATEGRSDHLLKANVTVSSQSTCNKSYQNYRKLPRGIISEQICAGDPEGLRDTCQGDSGGPLQGDIDDDGQLRIVGITSFGRGCGSPVPGVYTRVSAYLDWIENIVWRP